MDQGRRFTWRDDIDPKNQRNAVHQLQVQPARKLQAREPARPFQKESIRVEQGKPQPKQLGPVNRVASLRTVLSAGRVNDRRSLPEQGQRGCDRKMGRRVFTP